MTQKVRRQTQRRKAGRPYLIGGIWMLAACAVLYAAWFVGFIPIFEVLFGVVISLGVGAGVGSLIVWRIESGRA